jgi:hypothetical protein
VPAGRDSVPSSFDIGGGALARPRGQARGASPYDHAAARTQASDQGLLLRRVSPRNRGRSQKPCPIRLLLSVRESGPARTIFKEKAAATIPAKVFFSESRLRRLVSPPRNP